MIVAAKFAQFFLGTKLGRGLSLALVVVLGLAFFWGVAQRDVIETIEDENDAAISNADKAEIGFMRCQSDGGVWDFTPPGHCVGVE